MTAPTPSPDARNRALNAAMGEMYGSHGPDLDVDIDAIRQILGTVFDAGVKAAKEA